MSRKNARWTVFGSLLFFATIAITVMIAVMIYAWVDERTGGNRNIVALVMLLVITFLSVLWTLADIIRRRIMVDAPV